MCCGCDWCVSWFVWLLRCVLGMTVTVIGVGVGVGVGVVCCPGTTCAYPVVGRVFPSTNLWRSCVRVC